MPGLRESIATLLERSYGLSRADFDDDTALFSDGLLDSFVLMELITHLEKTESVKFPTVSFRLDKFDSINEIVALVESLKPAQQRP